MRRLLLCAALAFVATTSDPARAEGERVVVASKKFPESALLAEILAQRLENQGLTVERRLDLGNTAVVFESLRHDTVDVYPEYSGTAVEFLGVAANTPRERVRQSVEAVLRRDFDLCWGPPLGFENSYALAAREAFAQAHSLETVSDLAQLVDQSGARLGFTHEFLARADGWPGLAKAYGMHAEPKGVEHGMAYTLIDEGELDVTEVYTTEGLLHAHPLRVLRDDRGFFPPYEAAFLYGPKVARSSTALGAIVALAGRFDQATMQRLNFAVEVEHRPIPDVASEWLAKQGLGSAQQQPGPLRQRAGFWDFMAQPKTWSRVVRHVWLTCLAVLFGMLVGIPLGVAATRNKTFAGVVLGVASTLQTIPSLALLVLVIPLATFVATLTHADAMVVAALVALFAYSLLPIIRNTKEGLAQVDRAVIDAATGVGMSPWQRLRWVLVPLAAPFLFAGVRTATVIATGSATLAAFIGAGGLGEAIISGLSVQNYGEVLSGAVPAALLALGFDAGLGALQWWSTPKSARA